MTCPFCAPPEIVFTEQVALMGEEVLTASSCEVAILKTLIDNNGVATGEKLINAGGTTAGALKVHITRLNHALRPRKLQIQRVRQSAHPSKQVFGLFHNALWRNRE